MSLLSRAHIQVHESNSTVKHYWGYPDRIVPCANDAGSCEYLDAVYWMHEVSMLYTFIMWAVIGGVLAFLFILKVTQPNHKAHGVPSIENQSPVNGSSKFYRSWRACGATLRKWLLPESVVEFFGNVSRLQLLVLAILLGYLLIFSLVGIVYKTWITPVKKTTLHNTRTGLGGFSDRIGALAYALTPLTVALSTRESILTLITGIPYQSLNFLHRWLGRIIFIQSIIHTFGWTLIEGKFYQPQPSVYVNWIKQLYMVWGCVALVFIFFLYIFSLRRVIRWTGHEFFRKTHYVVAMLYIGACWGHWNGLACWMIASLGIWGLDRGIRFLRTGLIHVGYLNGSKDFGFHSAQSSVEYFDDVDGGVVRLEFKHNHDPWAIGQHYFLTFPALTIWQSHPFTVASIPATHPKIPEHMYIIRCRKGETGRLKSLASNLEQNDQASATTTPVILCGPYGTPLLKHPEPTNILAIAGGTGISITLPVVLAATASRRYSGAAIDFIWIIRRASNTQWIAHELQELKTLAKSSKYDLRMHIYVTQESAASSSPAPSTKAHEKASLEIVATPSSETSSSLQTLEKEIGDERYKTTYMDAERPSLNQIVSGFLDSRASPEFRTRVIASGPAGIGHDLRAAVASCNDGAKVWRGERRWDVSLDWDDRMG